MFRGIASGRECLPELNPVGFGPIHQEVLDRQPPMAMSLDLPNLASLLRCYQLKDSFTDFVLHRNLGYLGSLKLNDSCLVISVMCPRGRDRCSEPAFSGSEIITL
jgi:hypothetical protein